MTEVISGGGGGDDDVDDDDDGVVVVVRFLSSLSLPLLGVVVVVREAVARLIMSCSAPPMPRSRWMKTIWRFLRG